VVAWRQRVGVRLLAPRSGEILRLDTAAILEDPRVVECHLSRRPGHRVVLPPDDYDSRVLGHVIFVPDSSKRLAAQCTDISMKLRVEMRAVA
jgi:hypothetical protein